MRKSLKYRLLFGVLMVVLAMWVAGCSKSARRDKYIARADGYFQAGDYEKAKIEYFNALRIEPTNGAGIRGVGLIMYEQGATSATREFLRQARLLNSDDFLVRLRLAQVNASVGNVGDARRDLLPALDRYATNDLAILLVASTTTNAQGIAETSQLLSALQAKTGPRPVYLVAQAYFSLRERKLADAQRLLQQALKVQASMPEAHALLAETYIAQSNAPMALQELKAAADAAPFRSTIKLSYAQELAWSGRVQEARQYVADWTKKVPDYLPALRFLAQLAAGERKYDEALALTARCLKIDRLDYQTREARAIIELERGQPENAIQELETLESLYPSKLQPRIMQPKWRLAFANYRAAQIYLKNRQPTKALAAVDRAISLYTNFTDAIVLKAEINARAGSPADAASSMEALLARTNAPTAMLALANAYRQSQRLDEAANLYQRLVNQFPTNPMLPVYLGMTLRDENKLSQAREAFDRALTVAPGNLPVLYQIVELDIRTTNYQRAWNLVQAQSRHTTNAAAILYLQARIDGAQGRHDRSEAGLRKAIDLNPDFLDAYYLLISTYAEQNKLQSAVDETKRLLDRSPNDMRALTMQALVYERLKDVAKAADAYERLVAKQPNFVPALNNLAYLYLGGKEKLDRALELARKAHQLSTDKPAQVGAASDTLGWVYFKRGEFNQALPLLRQGAEALPGNPDVLYHLGMTYYMLGQAESARLVFQQAIKSSEPFSNRQETEQQLALLAKGAQPKTTGSIPELEKAVRENPNDAPVWAGLAELYESQRQTNKAATALEQVYRLNPQSSVALRLATLYAGPLKQAARAADWARKARAADPSNPEAAFLLGHFAYASADYPLAYNLLAPAARSLPNRGDVHYDFAWSAYSMGKIAEAEQAMRRVVQVEAPDNLRAAAKSFLAMTSLAGNPKDVSQAEAQVNETLKSDPGNAAALMAQARLLGAKGETQRAAAVYERILQRFPRFAPAMKYLAAIYADNAATEAKAYELATTAREALPDDVTVNRTLAKLSYARKEYRYAARLLQETIKQSPEDAEAWYYLGLAHNQLKEAAQSKEALRKAIAFGLREPLLTEANRLMNSTSTK